MATKYQVRVTNAFRSTTSANRSTAGITVPTDGTGYVGELSKDQLAELQADKYVTVTTTDGKPVDEVQDVTVASTEAELAQAAEQAEAVEIVTDPEPHPLAVKTEPVPEADTAPAKSKSEERREAVQKAAKKG